MAHKRIYRLDLTSSNGWVFMPQQVDMVYQDGYPVFTLEFDGADDASEMIDMYNAGTLRGVSFSISIGVENYTEIIKAQNFTITELDSSETGGGYHVTAKMLSKAAKEASVVPTNFYSIGKYDYTVRGFMSAIIAQFNAGKPADTRINGVISRVPVDVVYCGPYRFWRQPALSILRAVGSYHGLEVWLDVDGVVKVFHMPTLQLGSEKKVAKHQYSSMSLAVDVVGGET